ncbi:MAG: prolipoprotein diacylglyceryl transferase [Candidatus Omnitrophica bacterium]|nr:prolipoprotein diacylglyceryl transferase [Candidatus Omnitrophota bacterium]
MHPTIGQIGPLTIYSFGLMLAVAVVVCSSLLSRDAKKAGISQDIIFDFVFWVILAGIAGARIFFILLNLGDFIANPQQIIMISNGGLAWQGGLIFGGLTGLFYIKRKKLSLRVMADLSAPYLALGQAIGRIGCFLNGCCYGREVSWGIYFPGHDAHLHPTQLYEAAYLLAAFFVLKYLQKKSLIRGEIFTVYLMLAAAGRFMNEFFRADHINTAVGLSIFQLVSLGVFFVGLYLWRRLHRPAKAAS